MKKWLRKDWLTLLLDLFVIAMWLYKIECTLFSDFLLLLFVGVCFLFHYTRYREIKDNEKNQRDYSH